MLLAETPPRREQSGTWHGGQALAPHPLSLPRWQDNPRTDLQRPEAVYGDESEAVRRLHAAVQGRKAEVSASLPTGFLVIRHQPPLLLSQAPLSLLPQGPVPNEGTRRDVAKDRRAGPA